jgi:NTP pyrophosphatase (non-canonical NTP hydrolase)
MRLLVARCEVRYTGRLSAFLPEATRLLLLKDDGSVLVHADAGGYKPLNWMTPPTVVEQDGEAIVVRKRAGKTEDRLEIRLLEVLSDVSHDMGEPAGLEKDGVEKQLQEELAEFEEAPTDEDMAEEMGDVLFALVNVARFKSIEPEQALQQTNDKFTRRFNYIEQRVKESGRKFSDLSLTEMDLIWDEAKAKGL